MDLFTWETLSKFLIRTVNFQLYKICKYTYVDTSKDDGNNRTCY